MKLDKRQKTGLMLIGICLVMVILSVLTFMKSSGKEEKDDKDENIYHEVPEGTASDVPDSKSDAYVAEDMRRPSIVEHWDMCVENSEVEQDEEAGTGSAAQASSEQLFGTGVSASSGAAPRQYDNPYRETHEQREERHRRRQEEAIELAERMAAPEEVPQEETQEEEEVPEEVAEESLSAISRRTSSVSSLDTEDDSEGISSLDSDEVILEEDMERPFRCMFAREGRIRNGQRVSVILLEDMVVSGTHVPKNTHLMATCRLSQRLEMEIENIDMGGRILHLGYEAYDVDGSRGIYCPDVPAAGRTAKSRGTGIIGSNLTRRLDRITGEVVTAGISIAQNASGEVTVSVPAGYEFYIIRKK